MADTVNVILDYLRRHHFTKAEAALRGELVNRQGSNGALPLSFTGNLSMAGSREENADEGKEGRGRQGAEFRSFQNKDEKSKFVSEDIAFDEEYCHKGEIMNSRSVADGSSFQDNVTDTELIVKEVEYNPIKHGHGEEHKNGRNSPVNVESKQQLVRNAQRTLYDSAGTSDTVVMFQEASARAENIFHPDKYAENSGAGHIQNLGPSEGLNKNKIHNAKKFVDMEKEEIATGSNSEVQGLPVKVRTTMEMRNGKKAPSGSLYEEELVPYPSNPMSEKNGKGSARILDSDGDRSMLSLGEKGVFIRCEERDLWSEGKNATAEEGMFAEQSRFAQGPEAVIHFPSGGTRSEQVKQDILSYYDPLPENIPLKPEDCRTISLDPWKGGRNKTAFPYPLISNPANLGQPLQTLNLEQAGNSGKEVNRQVVWKESVLAKERADLHILKAQENTEQEKLETLEIMVTPEKPLEGLPRLPPVRLKSEEKNLSFLQEGLDRGDKSDQAVSSTKATNMEGTFLLGSFLDVPVGQEITNSGGKRMMGSSRLSVSQGIAEDASELVSGNAAIGDGLSESIDYPNEYWDSDEYEDDDDLGYIRQPIEDEAWFLAHEIDYPSDNEKGTGHGSIPDQQERDAGKDEDDDQSFVEEDSYFSGEQYFQSKNIEQIAGSEDPVGRSTTGMYGTNEDSDLIAQYDGQLMDEEELALMRQEPVWQGFVTQNNELVMLGGERAINDLERPRPEDFGVEDDQHGSVRSIGIGIHSDVADFGSEIRESLVGGSSEGDIEYFHDREIGICGSKQVRYDRSRSSHERSEKAKETLTCEDSSKYDAVDENEDLLTSRNYGSWSDRRNNGNSQAGHSSCEDQDTVKHVVKGRDAESGGLDFGGFSFPSPSSTGDMVGSKAESGKSLWSTKGNMTLCQDVDDYGNEIVERDDILASWRRKSNESSPVLSSRDEKQANVQRSAHSTASTYSNYELGEQELQKRETEENLNDPKEDEEAEVIDDEEAAAVQEQVRQIRAQEDEFETFTLKIVHRKNRTGFEEDKNFHVVLNSVIAGRYHVTEYLGSAAFSKAIQAHDLHTGMDVCMKIIKNNKDFFDQSLDEIKLLKYVNKHDPADKYHILRLYDYFYYREHLLIVCELLKANLYEFHKFNRESGGEVYFTMPRLQSITIQCLEALHFLHTLGLIHCDLKPENILVKSYSRCEVKVIDLGSSCFQTDHLCSYVQSRSYRAPEVILGLPYDKKIDIWSLGCILAELCSGNVLFQNDSPATLLARVVGIIGSIDQDMLVKGRDTYKYFTKNHMLYERNQDSNRLEYLIPKKTSLRHRLPMGDQGFIDFVEYLLEINPSKRPTAGEALKHPWLSYPYEPISS